MNMKLVIILGMLVIIAVAVTAYFVGYNANESYGSFSFKKTLGECSGDSGCSYEEISCRSQVIDGVPRTCSSDSLADKTCKYRFNEYNNYVTGTSFVCRIAIPA